MPTKTIYTFIQSLGVYDAYNFTHQKINRQDILNVYGNVLFHHCTDLRCTIKYIF